MRQASYCGESFVDIAMYSILREELKDEVS
jgi:hypothetical protein